MIDEATKARRYLLSQLTGLCSRLKCDSTQMTAELCVAFVAALDACIMAVDRNLMSPMVEAIPESRALFNLVGDLVVQKQSHLYGQENMARALAFMADGGNVLMVQNHTSGADTVVWDRLVSRAFPNAETDKFAYLAGHVVNYFLLPMTMTTAFPKFQIFSSKYKADGLEEFSAETMDRQNKAALMALSNYCLPGGRLVGLYPEGGRGEGALLRGDPKTSKILEIMLGSSPKGLAVLPTYIAGATSILPVIRREDEFVRFIDHIRPGVADITCGEPIPAIQMMPRPDAITAYVANHQDVEARIAGKILLHEAMMRSIAALAPIDARGPWA